MIGYIYLIRSNKTDEFYIGSTMMSLKRRFYGHRTAFKKYLEGKKKYLSSFEILKHKDAYIELFEETNVQSKEELQDIEGIYIKNCKDDTNCVNKTIPNHARLCGGIEEYNVEYKKRNADLIKAQTKIYRSENTDLIKERTLKYKRENADHVKNYAKEYKRNNAESIKAYNEEYRKKNSDLIKEKQEQYRRENVDLIKARKAEYRKKNAELIRLKKAEYRMKKKLLKEELHNI